MKATAPTFDEPSLALAVEQLSPDAVDRLPFGAIHVDDDGTVRVYSAAEASLSGYGARGAIGRRFFSEIAPCMNNPKFLGRIERARAQGALDIEFGYVGDFDDRDKELRVRVQQASAGGYWIFTARS